MQTTTNVETLRELEQFATEVLQNQILPSRERATVVALSGDLGAGKTTLVQLIAKALGVKEVVTSPTFTIMKSYPCAEAAVFSQLVHMDAYRIEEQGELRPLHLSEIMATPGVLLCVEWAERIKAILPKETIFIEITTEGENRRLLRVTKEI